ncbi:MAG: hypothetical protein K0R39_2848 [Symbiobacteriaceae bacterium]|jgi:hypothetical protein|nr:hypothetical protein [Symbiobacteriaceae bacterium]
MSEYVLEGPRGAAKRRRKAATIRNRPLRLGYARDKSQNLAPGRDGPSTLALARFGSRKLATRTRKPYSHKA